MSTARLDPSTLPINAACGRGVFSRLALMVAVMVAGPAIAQPAIEPQPADPLRSDACRAALARLDAHEATQSPPREAPGSAEHGGSGGASPSAARRPENAAARARLVRAREAAAQACLGPVKPMPAPGRAGIATPGAPVVVPPAAAPPVRPAIGPDGVLVPGPTSTPPQTPSLAPTAKPTPPAPQPTRRPLVTTSCDPAGCWADDGSRLQRFGNQLVGPRGVCTVTGSVLNCP